MIKNVPEEFGLSKQVVKGQKSFQEAVDKKSNMTLTGNGGVAYESTNDPFVDDFVNFTRQTGWTESQLINHISNLYSKDPKKAVANTFLLRAITREIKDEKNNSKGRVVGNGFRQPAKIRLYYILQGATQEQQKLIYYYMCLLGRFKDIIDILVYDLKDDDWNKRKLNWNIAVEVYLSFMESELKDLALKYLPQLRSSGNLSKRGKEAEAKTLIAKYFARKMFPDVNDKVKRYMLYRKVKSSGKAHDFQKYISRKQFEEIDFDKIPTRAMMMLINTSVVNTQLDRFRNWLKTTKRKLVFKGYPYEILNVNTVSTNNRARIELYNKMFLDMARDVQTHADIFTIIDTSGSMYSNAPNSNVSALDIAKSLAVFFSYKNTGVFKDYYAVFSDYSEIKKWRTNTPISRFREIPELCCSTNVISFAREFVSLVKRERVTVDSLPRVFLFISDGQFNYTGSKTASQKIFKILDGISRNYSKKVKLIFWDIANTAYSNIEKVTFQIDKSDNEQIIHITGFDGNIIEFLITGKEKDKIVRDMAEAYQNALDQPVIKEIMEAF